MDERSLRARTDVTVVADPERKRLLWVPRDLWCPDLGERVNRAYELGGHAGLSDALAEHGIEAEHALILSRAATERVIAGLDVMMPVARAFTLTVPDVPGGEIEKASREVRFDPPATRLNGDLIHDWVAGRYSTDLREAGDLGRIRRQQLLLAVLLGERADLRGALDCPDEFDLTSQAALGELAAVHANWILETLGPLTPRRIDGKEVLTRGRAV
jgi:anionic cell wall polymer biosynthesis LytR-Cps2A-Psr (LCP) family protein